MAKVLDGRPHTNHIMPQKLTEAVPLAMVVHTISSKFTNSPVNSSTWAGTLTHKLKNTNPRAGVASLGQAWPWQRN